ncbi:MAG: hypothetical protein HYS86_05075 [Candidatus Chisholmbacteria bacterium]|nr:hypothetical protein [Candidatus Chisholmbacteria bacterium]
MDVPVSIGEKLGTFFAFGSSPQSLGDLVTRSIDVIIIFAIILSLIFLFMGGISWVTAGDNKDQLSGARNRIMHALLGLAITIAIWGLWVLVVRDFLGIDITGGITVGGP